MLPIVSSEWGYSTAKGELSESRQADYLARQWLANYAAGVNLSIFYDWRDDGNDPVEREHRFGTVRRGFEPKPSFLAAQRLIRTLRGFTFRHRLAGGSPSDWRLLFQKSDDPDQLVLVEWSADPRAAADLQTPRYQALRGDSAAARPLRALADVRFPAGPLAETQGEPVELPLVVTNPQRQPAHVRLIAEVPGQTGQSTRDLTVGPGEQTTASFALPGASLRTEHRQVQLSVRWNDAALPAMAPLEVWRADPLSITAAPRQNDLEVAVENPARTLFSGELHLLPEDHGTQATTVRIEAGQDRAVYHLPLRAGVHRVALLDVKNHPVAELEPVRYQAAEGFTTTSQPSGNFDAILHVNNAPQAPRPLPVVATAREAPAPSAVEVSYRFDAGWRYLVVASRRPLVVPGDARAALIWVRGNDSGSFLRSRLTDATGQTFQPDLGRLDWQGWRPLRVDLHTLGRAGHWGGAGDGVPHGPLTWEALLLIDSSRKPQAQQQSIQVASLLYELGE